MLNVLFSSFTHEVLISSPELIWKYSSVPDRAGIWVLVVDERGKPCGVSEGKTTRKTRCTYVRTDCIASAPGGNRTQATVGTGECFHYGVNLPRRHKYGGWKSVLNGQINQRKDISKDNLDLNKQHRREARFWFGSGLETASIAIHHNLSPTPTALQIALAFSKT